VSRLTDLIAQAKAKDPRLGADLDREFKVLSSRLPFGLNFERHSPEAIEVPERPVRKGDKVRVLSQRGGKKRGDQRLWQVTTIRRSDSGKVADLELLGAPEKEAQVISVSDLVVVAEFRDTIFPGLMSTGKIERGGNKPYQTVINGENYHVLKALTYTHRGGWMWSILTRPTILERRIGNTTTITSKATTSIDTASGWQNRCVRDTKTFHAVNLELTIHD
jgi:adenine-specific DNA-methyltransferase